MAGNLNTMRFLLVGKVETTDGTDAAPTNVDTIYLTGPVVPTLTHMFNNESRDLIRGGSLSPWEPLIPIGRVGEWQISSHLRGARSGAAYSASNVPDLGVVFQGLGFSQTVVTTSGSETVTYEPASTSHKGVTYWYYTDGKVRKIVGAKTTSLSLSGSAGGPVVVAATVKGLAGTPVDAALPTTTTASFGTADPPLCKGLTVTVAGATTYIVRDFNFTITGGVADRPAINGTDGLQPPKVRTQSGSFTLTLEDDLIATKDWEDARTDGTAFGISIPIGVLQYKKVTLSTPKARLTAIEPGDDNGTQIIKLTGSMFASDVASSDFFKALFD